MKLSLFKDYIAQQHLLSDGEEVLLAVSGGRDSVCMAHLMHAAGYRFVIAHCNFHLRPKDCDLDQDFVSRMAAELGVPFYTTDFDTRAVASTNGMSVEEAARELRFGWFEDLCGKLGLQTVATAHHRDDSIETFFLNLFRGTGIAGLHGIQPRSQFRRLNIIHPMLCFSRDDINRYVAEHHLPFVEDSTNGELDARRNRIRLQLMPLLRELYPSVDSTMVANMQRLSDVEQVFRSCVSALGAGLGEYRQSPFGFRYLSYKLSDLADLSPRQTLLYELLKPFGFTPSVVADLAAALPSARTGSRFLSSTHEALIDRDRLVVVEKKEITAPKVDITTIALDEFSPQEINQKSRTVEYVDADRVHQPLTLRLWRQGDRFQPLGMNHQRLVSDVMKDAKLNIVEKRHIHMLVDADDNIVWVVGLRTDHRYRITDATRSALRLSVDYS